jgi:hypothetical protein
MGVDAIDETIYPSVLGMTKCSIAFGRWPHAIEVYNNVNLYFILTCYSQLFTVKLWYWFFINEGLSMDLVCF